MSQTIKSTDTINYSIFPSTVQAEIAQNVLFILRTMKTSVPLDRNIGITGDYYGSSTAVAEALLYQEILDEIDEMEPRVKIDSITFESDPKTGKLIPILEVAPNDE